MITQLNNIILHNMIRYEKLIKDKYLHIKYCISDSQIKDIIGPSKRY